MVLFPSVVRVRNADTKLADEPEAQHAMVGFPALESWSPCRGYEWTRPPSAHYRCGEQAGDIVIDDVGRVKRELWEGNSRAGRRGR